MFLSLLLSAYLLVLRIIISIKMPEVRTTLAWRAVITQGLEEEEIREKEFLYQKIELNEAGFPLSEETYMEDGSLQHRFTYRYDDQNRVVEEILTEGDGMISEHRSMEYDEQGRLSRELLHYQDETCDVTEFVRDENGRTLVKRTLDSDGEEETRTEFVYDKGNLVTQKTYTSGDKTEEVNYTFDADNHLLEEEGELPDGSYSIVNEYDENGRQSLSKRYNSEGNLVERNIFTYAETGELELLKTETVSGITFTNLQHDENGRLLVQEEKDETDQPVSRLQRTYDEQGRLLTSSVNIAGSSYRAPQDYRIRYEYR